MDSAQNADKISWINRNITKKHNIIAEFEKLLSTFHFPTLNFSGAASNEEHQLRHFFWHCKHIRPFSGMVSATSAGMIHLPQAAYQYPLHPFRLLSAIRWMIFFFVIPYLFTWNPSIPFSETCLSGTKHGCSRSWRYPWEQPPTEYRRRSTSIQPDCAKFLAAH